MSHIAVRRLRLQLFTAWRSCRTAPAMVTCSHLRSQPARSLFWGSDAKARDGTHDYAKRVAELEAQRPLSECYPRLHARQLPTVPIGRVLERCVTMTPGDTEGEVSTVAGKVQSIRTAGSKLFFVDLKQNNDRGSSMIQIVGDLSKLGGTPLDEFKKFLKIARKGDWCITTGYAHKTNAGQPSIMATALPDIVAPSLHQVPTQLDDPETKARMPHANMLVNPEAIETIWLAHHIDAAVRAFFILKGFVSVRTPLLNAGAGGAVARPFETEATELEGQKLNLRIAPELWLKRLVVGGLAKVYEIGPAFRNEGVDATHNPEFNICEFYEAFATLDRMMNRTQFLLSFITKRLEAEYAARHFQRISPPEIKFTMDTKFERCEFIPFIEEAIRQPLPDLSSEDATAQLLDLFKAKQITTPAKATLPRLLDALAGHYIEPFCKCPTFITHHPAALSPLSKHFTCPKTNQIVAARAELFIDGREYANMYEEENSPFEQRRKLEEQLKFREVDGESDGRAEVDESYLEALEWGLPPTGGWGCGMDRLVMLFGGKERMADVLPFGSLRNVVGLGKRR